MLNKLGITLSLAFGILFLAIAAEVWYLLWWRKRTTHSTSEIDQGNIKGRMLYDSICFWNTPSTTTNSNIDVENKNHEKDLELGTTTSSDDININDVVVMKSSFGEESVEEELSELMRLHNLAGPPRFLFTIKEETREDLESEDGKSRCGDDNDESSRKGSTRRTRSTLSDLMVAIDTPFLNLAASSTLKSSLDNISIDVDSCNHQEFNNPLFELSVESELNRFRSSPPPKFKFLRDAEEKLFRRLIEEAHRRAQLSSIVSEAGGQSEIKDSTNSTMVTKNKETHQIQVQPQFPSSSSKVLPLTSSPSMVH